MKEFVSVEEARKIVVESVRERDTCVVPILGSLGGYLAEEVTAGDDIPPFANSAMDGYAVRSSDATGDRTTLSVTQDIPAGTFSETVVGAGSCARIMTGAPMPPGADAVVPVEWVEVEGNMISFARPVAPALNVRPKGKDVAAGERIFSRGHRIDPPTVGMLAAVGRERVAVYERPSVTIVATGDELVAAGDKLEPGKIRNSNGPGLSAQTVQLGCEVREAIVARDNPGSVRSAIARALHADAIVISGGVSVGEYDYVNEVLDEMGFEMLFWRVRQRPGKPLAFGLLDGKPVFGLPGNPVSAALCFHQYVRPALMKMQGAETSGRQLFATLVDDFEKVEQLHYFSRGEWWTTERGMVEARVAGAQGSNIYSALVRAGCVIHLPAGQDCVKAGSIVRIEPLDW